MKNLTVRHLTDYKQLDGGKTYFDLPIIFEGTEEECFDFCTKLENIKFKSDESIFEGYFYLEETGDCYFIF